MVLSALNQVANVLINNLQEPSESKMEKSKFQPMGMKKAAENGGFGPIHHGHNLPTIYIE